MITTNTKYHKSYDAQSHLYIYIYICYMYIPEEQTVVKNGTRERHFLLHHNTQFSSKSISIADNKKDSV